MTTREKTALLLLAVGVAALVWCAYAYGGVRAAAGVAGVLAVACGLLLGVGEEPPPELAADEEYFADADGPER